MKWVATTAVSTVAMKAASSVVHLVCLLVENWVVLKVVLMAALTADRKAVHLAANLVFLLVEW